MVSEPERIVLTYEDLVDTPDDGKRYELYEGELEVSAAPTPGHQSVVVKLTSRLEPYITREDLGRLYVAPVDVKFSDISVAEPDLVFVSKARLEIIRPQFILGAPDLVVEVLSPSTATRDRRTKRNLYAQYGVPYYWIVDLSTKSIEALALTGSRYRVVTRAENDALFRAPPFPELVIPLAEVWA